MPFYFKPVVWNSNGYRGPSGGKFTSGFPKDHGYGHEEWNNAPELAYGEGADRFKVFHTEGLGTQDLEAQAGLIGLMLIASHKGQQFLVGVAAGCMPLMSEDERPVRLDLIRRLGLNADAMGEEAWALKSVRDAFDGNRRKFFQEWRRDFHWLLNWTCPADLYLPLYEPVLLSAEALTGKKRLVAMYGSYQPIDRSIFQRVLAQLPSSAGQATIDRLKAWAGPSIDVAYDVEEASSASTTVRAALIQARIGQGAFRSELMAAWNGGCAVTGCTIPELLRASHIRPWAASNNTQRLDSENGLMLAAHLDALFDRGLISFGDDGRMMVAKAISKEAKAVWGVGAALRRKPSGRLSEYLAYHRERVFVG